MCAYKFSFFYFRRAVMCHVGYPRAQPSASANACTQGSVYYPSLPEPQGRQFGEMETVRNTYCPYVRHSKCSKVLRLALHRAGPVQ